jgi:hypothetical protein
MREGVRDRNSSGDGQVMDSRARIEQPDLDGGSLGARRTHAAQLEGERLAFSRPRDGVARNLYRSNREPCQDGTSALHGEQPSN